MVLKQKISKPGSWMLAIAANTFLAMMIVLTPITITNPQTAPAAGKWYVVWNGDDANLCSLPVDPCLTVQAAFAKASPCDTIYIGIGVYYGSGPQVLLLDKDINLSGGWDDTFTSQTWYTSLDGNGQKRVVRVLSQVTASIDNITIRYGKSDSNGGGIYNEGVLSISNSTIHNNSTTAKGGGIYNVGTLNVTNTSVESNRAEAGGGGLDINAPGSITQITNSAIFRNIGGYQGSIGSGGGAGLAIWSETKIVNSSITKNQIQGSFYGNGILVNGYLEMLNSTVSGNYGGGGAGIYHSSGDLHLDSVTIAENEGQGIVNSAPLTIANSIFAAQPVDISSSQAQMTSLGYNLIESLSGFIPAATDLVGVQTDLFPLEGIPAYHALRPGSPAVDAGNPAGCVNHLGSPINQDQRGLSRFSICDIGAYELQPLEYSTKTASRERAYTNERVDFTITLENPKTEAIENVQVNDLLIYAFIYIPGTLTASSGTPQFTNDTVSWMGDIPAQSQVIIQFGTTVNPSHPLGIQAENTAEITGDGLVFNRSAPVLIDIYKLYLPCAIKLCLPLFFDDFSNPASGWPVGTWGSSKAEYLNGEYRMFVHDRYSGLATRPGFAAADYSVSVDLRNVYDKNGSYGILFGIADNWSTFYSFEVYPDGHFGVYWNNPSSIEVLIENFHPAVNQGTAANHLKVVRNGSSIEAYANGVLLASLTNYYDTGVRSLGLVVWSNDVNNVDIRFDNFTVYPVSCAGKNAPEAQTTKQQTPDYRELLSPAGGEKHRPVP